MPNISNRQSQVGTYKVKIVQPFTVKRSTCPRKEHPMSYKNELPNVLQKRTSNVLHDSSTNLVEKAHQPFSTKLVIFHHEWPSMFIILIQVVKCRFFKSFHLHNCFIKLITKSCWAEEKLFIAEAMFPSCADKIFINIIFKTLFRVRPCLRWEWIWGIQFLLFCYLIQINVIIN